MLFTSLSFYVFLAVVLAVYYAAPKRFRWIALLAGSLLFSWSLSRFLILHLVVCSFGAWFVSRRFEASFSNEKQSLAASPDADKEAKKEIRRRFKRNRNRLCGISLSLLLASLLFFKFFNPLQDLTGGFYRVALPAGISFYTLTMAAYLCDTVNRTAEIERNPFRLLLYFSWFPALIQGPVNRHTLLSRDLRCEGEYDHTRFVLGFERALWGTAKKMIVADRLAVLTAALFSNHASYGGSGAFAGGILYAVQLYCDFSGGIDIALGVSDLFGIGLPENFRRPYFSRSVSQYWRRWHITLGTFLRDYVFYPLTLSDPMNRLGRALRKKNANLARTVPPLCSTAAVWLCSAVWHGEGGQYLAWGLFHFSMVTLDTFFESGIARRLSSCGKTMRRLGAAVQIAVTFLAVSFGELFFRADSLRDALAMAGSLFRRWDLSFFRLTNLLTLGLDRPDLAVAAVGTAFLFLHELLQETGKVPKPDRKISELALPLRWAVLIGGIAVIAVFGVYGSGYDPVPFQYFQF